MSLSLPKVLCLGMTGLSKLTEDWLLFSFEFEPSIHLVDLLVNSSLYQKLCSDEVAGEKAEDLDAIVCIPPGDCLPTELH
jgi:hypothetical protein